MEIILLIQVFYQPEWATQMDFICASEMGAMFAYCKVCNVHVNVSFGGKYDVVRHSKSASHNSTLKNVTKTQLQMKSFFVISKTTDLFTNVLTAEVKFAQFLAEHNLPFRWLTISRNWPSSRSPIAILRESSHRAVSRPPWSSRKRWPLVLMPALSSCVGTKPRRRKDTGQWHDLSIYRSAGIYWFLSIVNYLI